METKKLYRSAENRVFAGICGGLGEYSNIDPVVIRLFFLMFILGTGFFPGVLAYFLAIFIIPVKIVHHHTHKEYKKEDNKDKED